MGNAATTIEKEDGIVDSSISSTEDTYSKVPIHFSENMKSTTNKLDKIVGQARQKQDDTDNKIKFLEKENIFSPEGNHLVHLFQFSRDDCKSFHKIIQSLLPQIIMMLPLLISGCCHFI